MRRRVKILHIISSQESGFFSELEEFALHIPTDEFEGEICILKNSPCRNTLPVPATFLNLRWNVDINTYFGIRQILCRFRPDIIHTWDNTAQCFAAFTHRTTPILAEKRKVGMPKRTWQKYVDRKTSRFIVPHKEHDLPKEKTVTIPPIATLLPYTDPIPAENLLEKLGFPLLNIQGNYYPVFEPPYDPARHNYMPMPSHSTPFLIGIVLPLRYEHRILDALWVFETLQQVNLNFHVFIIGDGKDREHFLRSRDGWKLSSRVHFVGNPSFRRQETLQLFSSFDVLLHLSSSAEFAGTILTAMSCGIPVIALETPESREYITDGISGMIIPADGDFRFYRRSAATKLLYLLENKKHRQSISIAAKEYVDQKIDLESVVQCRTDLYREVLSTR